MLIGMKVSINISEEMYGKIKGLSEESLRPLALEIVYWLQKGLSSEGVKSGDKVPSQTQNKTKKEVDSRKDILDELLDSGKVSKGAQNIDGFKTYFK
jgi:DNA replication protein DnaD